MKNNYVLNHDFGYGKSIEKIKINKINLRNINDLKIYIKEALKASLVKEPPFQIIIEPISTEKT